MTKYAVGPGEQIDDTIAPISGTSASVLAVPVQVQPTDPTGTTSLTGVMMGCAVAFTPKLTGRIRVLVSGVGNNNTASDGGTLFIQYGTGTAPINAAAPTGTRTGNQPIFVSGTNKSSFTAVGFVLGLIPGTAYWFDVELAALTGGTASLTKLQFEIEEF